MPLIVPVLDDRSYKQLYDELRNRIPFYTLDWTDYNDSDPAITLLQLFAYLGESLQFRFNQIPEQTKLAFLRLLDLPLQPAKPATALVRFTCKDAQIKGVQVYRGDIVKAGKVEFTVETDTEVWPLDCVAIARNPDVMPDQIREPELHTAVQATIDAVSKTTPGFAPAYYRSAVLKSDGSSDPISFDNTIDGMVWIAVLKPGVKFDLKLHKPTINIGFSPAATTPELKGLPPCPGTGARVGPALQWEVSLKKRAADNTPQYRRLRVQDATAGFTEEGVARLFMGEGAAEIGVPDAIVDGENLAGTGAFPPFLDDDELTNQTWFWIRVWRPDKSRIGAVRLICVNAAMCTQAVKAGPEQLGSGSGQPRQTFELANRPVLIDSRNPVKLQVAENGVWKDWTQKEDLDASGPDDAHFVVDAEAGTVSFGARFPYLGERVRVTSYRYGGGAAGNVPAKAIAKFEAGQTGPSSSTSVVPRAASGDVDCGNPFPAVGGSDSESIEHALERVPGDVRRRTRAVTRDDFSELAKMTPGVSLGRAECLPLFHAPDQATPRAGCVSVVVWPKSDPVHPNAPLPDAYELRRVCEWLDTKRLVTTELYVIPPTYRRIAISVGVKVKDGFGLDAVRDWVDIVLRQYLAPLPEYGPEGRGWPLGRRVLGRELEGVVMQVDGVEYIEGLRLAGETSPNVWAEGPEVTLQAWEVPEVAAITIVDENTDLPAPGASLTPPPGDVPVPIPVLREEC